MPTPHFQTDWLQQACQGRWSAKPAARSAQGINTDTRTLEPGQAYLAIRGNRFDGHAFAAQAIQDRGAALAIVDEQAAETLDASLPLLIVQDTVAALQALAVAHRERLASPFSGGGGGGCRVIGVVGSNGKTTTRHMIHHWLIAGGLKGTQSPKSFNNHLGVPLTLLAAHPDDDFVACEIGTNHPGEIDALGAIARPDLTVITSIGEEHLAFFGDLEGVAREEAAIIAHTKDQGGLVLHAETLDWLTTIQTDLTGVCVHLAQEHAQATQDLPLPGAHNQQNARLAVTTGQLMGLPPEAGQWDGFEPPDGRLNTLVLPAGITVLHDAYNANPSSVRASLQVLSAWPGASRRVAILGPMNELGEQSRTAHTAIRQEAEQQADLPLFIGDAFQAPPWSEAHAESLVDQLKPGDVVLLKASRGQRLERLIPLIEKRFVSPEPPEKPEAGHPPPSP